MKNTKHQAANTKEAPSSKLQTVRTCRIVDWSLVIGAWGLSGVWCLVFGVFSAGLLHAADEAPFGIDHRIPWTTSRVIGSPDPPLPYTIERVFTNLTWKEPAFITPEPDTKRFF